MSVASPSGPAVSFPRVEGYELTAKLGQGGMGTVYRAKQLATRREVALKLMSIHGLGSEKSRRRFEREVELASSLEHPNIARVFDSGLVKNIYFYAMQLVPGEPLDKHVEKDQLDELGILKVFLKVCRGVEFAHRKGVIHRDLKPSNIMVTPEGDPFVLDFGLAKTLVDSGDHLTVSQEGDLTGTPAYMSPEQASGQMRSIDTRTDVYALGVILFRLLTQQHPHDLTGSTYDLTRRIIEQEPKRPRDLRSDIDRDLEAILLKCLEKEPGKRYGSAGGLAEDIERYLSEEPVSAQPATATYFLRKKLARHKVLVTSVSAVAAVMLIGVILSFFLINHARERADQLADEKGKLADEKSALAEQEKQAKIEAITAEGKERVQRQRAEVEADRARRSDYANRIGLAELEIQQANIMRARTLLDGCPADLRHYEWHRFRTIMDVSVATLRSHESLVTSVALSVDGKRLASGSWDRTIKVWDAERGGDAPLTLRGHKDIVTSVALSADGKRIVSGSYDKTIKVWDSDRDGRQNTLAHVFKDPASSAAPDRRAAEWVLQNIGTLEVKRGLSTTRVVLVLNDLPQENFTVSKIYLARRPIGDNDLVNLQGLNAPDLSPHLQFPALVSRSDGRTLHARSTAMEGTSAHAFAQRHFGGLRWATGDARRG